MDLQGWFTFRWLYEWIARNAGRSSRVPTFVEVGVWKGTSITFLARRLLAEKRMPFGLYAVDTWSMEPSGDENNAQNQYLDTLRAAGKTLYQTYRANVIRLGLADYITDVRLPSVEAAAKLGSIDFVFIDADHSAEAVVSDVSAWRPKAAILAGHDVGQPSVQQGLHRAFGPGGYHVLPFLNCWTTHKPLADEWVACSNRFAAELVECVKHNAVDYLRLAKGRLCHVA